MKPFTLLGVLESERHLLNVVPYLYGDFFRNHSRSES